MSFNAPIQFCWEKNTGGSKDDWFYSVASTNNGYVAVGESKSTDGPWGNTPKGHAIIVKYDCCGNICWARKDGGFGLDRFNSVAATSNNCYIAVRYFYEFACSLGE